MQFLSYYKSYLYNYVHHRYHYGLTQHSGYNTLLTPIAAYKAYKKHQQHLIKVRLKLHN